MPAAVYGAEFSVVQSTTCMPAHNILWQKKKNFITAPISVLIRPTSRTMS